jgi:hypothetical protein
MNLESLSANFDELNAEIATAKKTMQEKSVGFVEEAARQLFEACPEIGQVHWTQYTPYFNDGEACEFGVNDACFATVEDVEEGNIERYDSSVMYSQSDLDKARADYHTAALYEDDPEKWRVEYTADYKAKFGREPWRPECVRPYPDTTTKALENIERIQASLEKYNAETVDRIEKNFASFREMIGKIPEDIMQSIYGDHVMVTINRDGTEIDEYDHD